MIAASADRPDPAIGLQLEPQRLRVEELVVGDAENFPEQAEQGSIHAPWDDVLMNIILFGFAAISLSRLRIKVCLFYVDLRRTK
ncbi:MAG: hypothetical protein ACQEWZ_12235 [Pseudomonadota bacterium]